jgi:hypothetical protein
MTYLIVLLTFAQLVYVTRWIREPNVIIVLAACGLATFVAIRGPEVSSDFLEYQEWYRLGPAADGLLERPPVLESLYFGSMTASREFGLPFRLFLWIVAVTAISLKFYCIRHLATSKAGLWAGACCYLFSGFLLHEFTQLRAGLAIAFFMLSLLMLSEGRMRYYIVATCVGALFHSSALLGLIALPFSRVRRGLLDVVLVVVLALVVVGQASGVFSIARIADAMSLLDARVALYVEFANSGVNEPVEPFSIRAVLMLLLVVASYIAAVRRDRRRTKAETAMPVQRHQSIELMLLRLIVLGQIALFLFAEVRELAVRVMEFWTACLPLYAVLLAQTRGMRLPSLIVWLWLAATFANYVFRSPALVGPYSIGF